MDFTMEVESESPPAGQHTRKQSLPEPREPRAKRRAGNVAAVAAENAAVAASMHPPVPGATTSSSASDVPSSARGSTLATPVTTAHFCGNRARVHTEQQPEPTRLRETWATGVR